jgi:hypothetical protein
MDIHNLDINMYSFKEILGLFNIETDYPTVEDVQKAKKTVLMTHPDKSKLEPTYFLFYKKAFDVLKNYYENNLKQNVNIDKSDTDYTDYFDADDNKGIQSHIGKIEKVKFNSKFNKLFEENANIKNVDSEKNNWFKDEKPVFEKTEEIVNANSMNSVFNKFKEKNNGLIVHKNIQDMSRGGGTNLYDEEDANAYVTSDPFSKLKFDDLRKVHKDETIFSVSERDISKVKQYESIDEYSNARNNESLEPIDKGKAERMINTREKIRSDYIKEQQHKAYIKTLENEEKNKSFMSNFLHIGYK